MADERRIVVELSLKSAQKEDDDDEGLDLTEMLRTAQHPFHTAEKALFGKNAWANYAMQQTKQIVKNGVMYHINRYYNLTENYKAEVMLDNTLSVINHISEAYTSILGGAVIGSKAGPLGAVLGLVAGAGSWAVNTWFQAEKAFDEQNKNLSTMRIQSGYQRFRLGLIDDGRGTQN